MNIMFSEIEHKFSTVQINSLPAKNYEVGKSVTAKLYPGDVKKGSATSSPNADWMQSLNAEPGVNSGVVRGHLLNHDLGGEGLPYNLYPISTKANHAHSAKVEENVKDHLEEQAKYNHDNATHLGTYYNVVVEEDKASSPYKAAFICKWGKWDFSTKKEADGNMELEETIPSNLTDDAKSTFADVKDSLATKAAKIRPFTQDWKHTDKATWEKIESHHMWVTTNYPGLAVTPEKKGKGGHAELKALLHDSLRDRLYNYFVRKNWRGYGLDASHYVGGTLMYQWHNDNYKKPIQEEVVNTILNTIPWDSLLAIGEDIEKIEPSIAGFIQQFLAKNLSPAGKTKLGIT